MDHAKKQNRKQLLILIFTVIVFALCLLIYNKFMTNDQKVFILKEYSSKGNLLGINEYIIRDGDTIMHGKFINYFENGNKKSEGKFINGTLNGECLYYYDNGLKESNHFQKTTEISLEATWNYPNGQLEKYAMYTDFGKPLFIIKYDKKDIVDSYKGIPQLEIYQHKVDTISRNYEQIENHFVVGDKLKYSYLIANIPNAKRSFKIENMSVDNSKVKRTLKHIEPCQWDVEEVLTKKGKNTIQSIVKYEFKDKVTPVFIDTLSFDIEVH
ncbi:hypothetical protein EH230_13215 [Flavobacterium columnare]|uniref:MORN repeat variant n=1 Tax=Flavobacterium columnare TaxID=996 RepID=A0A437U800_9FLAO|nr:hypothetical protein [Flavobacterium columnare]RVU89731.1 hypothetical protein EH230_13215 [Flavobacterium columnare]